MKYEKKPENALITGLDIRIMLSIGICYLTATILSYWNINFVFGEMRLEIIQKITACISCLLCCQNDTASTEKAGNNRIIITAIGGFVAMVVVMIDTVVNNICLMVILVMAGTIITLVLCKAVKVSYVNARIGVLTFVLVTCMLPGPARIWYAFFRLISTLYGVLVVMLITFLLEGHENSNTR